MAMFKKWSKSEILLWTAVMKIFNFWQNFDSTSNLHKSFKSTKEHFKIQYWYLQYTHKSEMTTFIMWSKSQNFAKERGHENFQFLTKFSLNLKLPVMVQNNKNNTLEYYFDTWNWLTSQKWQWSKSGQNLKFRSGPRSWKFSIFDKIRLNLKLPQFVQMNKKTLLNVILILAIHSQVRNDNVQNVDKIWNFANFAFANSLVIKIFNFW